jgi:sugar diacid utilization regulator
MLLAERDDSVVVLAAHECDWQQFQAGCEHETHAACQIGVGGRCERPSAFPRSHRQAQIALRVLAAAGGHHSPAIFDELGVYRILAEASDPDRVERFVREWLGALLDYDARRNTNLFRR